MLFGLIFCFQSGFRSLTFVNTFCTVLSTSSGLIVDICLFFYSGKFSKAFSSLIRFTGEKLHSYVPFCLKYCVIPFTGVILIMWISQVPSILKTSWDNSEFLNISIGITVNAILLSPSIYFYFKSYKNKS